MIVCVDASIFVRYLTEPNDVDVESRFVAWIESGVEFVAPLLTRYEVANALHRYARSGQRTVSETELAMTQFLDMQVRLATNPSIHIAALRLARRMNAAAAYDAHYVAVAQQESAELWTADRRLYDAARAILPAVSLLVSRAL